MSKKSLQFVDSLNDSRFLLLYPDIVNQLYDIIIKFSDVQVNSINTIFGSLVDSLEDHRKILANLIRNSASLLVSNKFPKIKLLDIKTLKNNQIPPITELEKKNLISQSMIPFTSEQFKSLLKLLTPRELNTLLNTLKPYQVKDLSKNVEKFSFIGIM
jgi:hypothetical protein